jgi:tetratricopeptide (TPR) repeat protein
MVPGYELLGKLGHGGMGVVYQARQEGLGRLVALKMIRDGAHAEPELLARFRREAAAVARLQHPNIVQVYEVGEHDGRPFFSMEYVAGGGLVQQLDGTPQDPSAAAHLTQTLAGAVHAAHQQGVIHRDLKPANILLTVPCEPPAGAESARGAHLNEAIPKITDFGLAKVVTDTAQSARDTHTGAILGSPSYMAPEQAQAGDVGPAADVYSLGAILYELLTGRPPFKAATPLDTVLQLLHDDPVPPRRLQPKVPRDLETICLKCLEKVPSHRYATALELADDLKRFEEGASIYARPAGTGERALKWARRRPAVAALFGVSAAAALALLAGGLWYNARLRDEVGRRTAQQQQAKAQYREAREAIRRMLARAESRDLAGVPRLQDLRRQQMEDALAFYTVVLQQQDSPELAVRFDAALAFEEAGKIGQLLGQWQTGIEHTRQAEKLLRDLSEEDSANSDYQRHLVSCLNVLGLYDQPEAHFREAVRRCENFLRSDPEAPAWIYLLADSYRCLGNMYLRQQRNDEAETYYTSMRDLGKRLVQANPEPRSRELLAESYSRLGNLGGHGPQQADAYFRQAEQEFQRLTQEQPQQAYFALELAALYNNWGNLWAEHDDPARALELFARGIARMEQALRQEPELVEARLCLKNLHGARAYLLGRQKQYGKALDDWDLVIQLEVDQAVRDFRRSERAYVLAEAGDHGRAMAEVDELAMKKGVEARTLYNAACAAAKCAAAVRSNDKLDTPKSARQADHCAVQAVELLGRVRTSSLFPASDFLKRLQTEPDFRVLQNRNDFQKLVAEVERGLFSPNLTTLEDK